MRAKRKWALILVLGLALSGCATDEPSGQDTGDDQAAACSVERLEAAASAFTRVGPQAGKPLAQAGRTVKIGFFGDLTGANSALVIHAKQAAELAVEQANAAGDLPVTIQLELADNKDGDPNTAPALAQRLIGDEAVVGVIGPAFSGETLSTGELFADAGLTNVSQSATNPELTQKGWRTFFRALANDAVQGGQTGPLIVNALGCERIALINDRSEYGVGLAEAVKASIEEAGGEIVLDEGIEPTTDYTSIIGSVGAAEHDAVYYAGYAKEASLVVKQYEEGGGEGLFLSGDGSKDDTFLTAGAPESAGSVITCPCLDPAASDAPEAAKFVQDYQAKFNTPPGVYSAEGWDVAQMFIAAIRDAGANVSRESVLQFITNLEDFEGLSKTFNWTEQHEVVEGDITYVYTVEDNGQFALVGRADELAE